MITVAARKAGGVFAPLDRELMKASIQALGDGDYVITIRPKKAQRSVQSNRRYWALLTVAARELGYDDVEELHEGIALKLLPLPSLVPGVPRRRRTPALNTAEFAEYTDAVERFLMMDLGVDLSGWQQEAEGAA